MDLYSEQKLGKAVLFFFFLSCSSSIAKWAKLLHYSHFMCEKNIFSFLENSNKIFIKVSLST